MRSTISAYMTLDEIEGPLTLDASHAFAWATEKDYETQVRMCGDFAELAVGAAMRGLVHRVSEFSWEAIAYARAVKA